MKIHEYNEMMRHLTRREPSDKHLAAMPLYEQGGRVGFKRGSGNPIPITDKTLETVNKLIKGSSKSLKEIGRDLGYAADLRSDSYIIKAYEKKYGKIPSERFRPYKLANDPGYVKKVVDEVKKSSIQATAEKRGVDRKTIKNILNQEAPQLRGKTNIAGPETGAKELKKRRLKIEKELRQYWKGQKGGNLILEEMDKKLTKIKAENKKILKMSDDAIWNNKKFRNAMQLNVKKLKAGEGLKFDRYPGISKKDFVKKVKYLADKGEFVQPEHSIPLKAKNPNSLLAKNIFPAYGKVGGQLEVLKDFSKANTMGKIPTEVFNFLKGQNIPIEKPGFLKTTKKVGSKVGKALFGPVEAGLLPLAVAAEGLYANYADKRDLKKALDQMDIPQEQKDLLLEGFRQESRDLGGVGLETYAIEQPNIQKKLEEIGYGDRTELLKAARAPIAAIREQDAKAKQLKKQEIEKRTKEAYEDAIGRSSKRPIEFKKGGRVSFVSGGFTRRGFLKLLAALGIGGVGAKSGAFLFSKAAGKKAAVKTGVDVVTGTPGMPSWFPSLVNKIIKEGDDVTSKLATKDRQIVHSKKVEGHDVDVYRDLDTGDIRVSVEGNTGKNLTAYDEGLTLEYRAGEVIDEGKYAGKKTKPEFSNSEMEAEFVRMGPDDAELDFSFRNQSIYPNTPSAGSKSISDTSFLKNYATNKKPTLKEIAQTSNNKKQIKYLKENPHEDPRIPGPGDYQDYDDYLPDIDDIN